MEISKLKTLTTPNLNDILPILDINGGISGRPILRKATLGSLLALAEGNSSSGFEIPAVIKTAAESGDYFIGIDSDGMFYRITKADLLAGLSSSGSTGDIYFSDVILLLPFDANVDDIKGHLTTTVGSPAIDSNIFKYGTGSLSLNGNSYLSITNTSDLALGSSHFTIECWIYPEFSNQIKVVANHRNSYLNDQAWSINTYHPDGIGKISFFANNGNAIVLNSSFQPPINTWSHIAICRSDNTFTLYGNGINCCSTTSNLSIQSTTSNLYIGYAPDAPNEKWLGNIDDFRITKRCLYSSNFTPPSKLSTQ